MRLSRIQRFHLLRTLQIGWPIMLGQLGHMLTGLADSAMIGQVDKVQLAAASLGHNAWVIFFVVGLGMSMGLTPFVAAADGRRDRQENALLLRQGLWVNGGIGIGLMALMMIATPLLDNLGQPPAVVAYAKPYFLIIAGSLLPLMIFQHYRQFAEGLSLTRVAMYISIGGNLLNVFLNYLLIFGVFGFPRLELVGAGLATLIARCVMAFFMFYYVRTGVPFRPFWSLRTGLTIQWRVVKKIGQVGGPIGMQYLFEAGAFVAAALMIGWLGTAPLAAHQIAITLAATTFLTASGISAAVTVRVGKFHGANNPVELRRAAFTGYFLVGLFMAITGVAFILLRHQLPILFTPDAAVQDITATLLIVAGVFQISDGMQVTGMATLRGLKDVKKPTLIALFSYWFVGLPSGYGLSFVVEMGAQGVWWGLAIGLTVAGLLLYVRFQHFSKKLLGFAPTPKSTIG